MTTLCKTKVFAMMLVALGRQYVERHLIAKAGKVDEGPRRRQGLTAHTLHVAYVVAAKTTKLTLIPLLVSASGRKRFTQLTQRMMSTGRQQLTQLTQRMTSRNTLLSRSA